jgi:mono/diheme cytochrome c family protein
MRFVLLAAVLGQVLAAAAPNAAPVTFNKDVLPILQKNCQTCHRPGEVAPMSLLTYGDARPWAKAIKVAVATKKMPPWFAEPGYRQIANERKLTAREIETLVAWVDNGAVEGDPKDAPAPLSFIDGWNITPDIVVEMPKPFELPATGTINYKYVLVKTNFPQDMWIQAAEMRPGNPKVLHHGKVWVRPPESEWMQNAEPGVAYEAETQKEFMGRNALGEGNDIVGKFNPGLGGQTFDVEGAAKFVPKGSDLVFELHYTAMGKPTTDVSKLGLVLAKQPPTQRYFLTASPASTNLVIPPGDSNAEVVGEATVETEAKLTYVQPHMHLRGKDYELRLIYPTGESDTVFRGKFDFNWQQGFTFEKPIPMPKGTRLVGIAHFDNSVNNPFNPDPTKEVRWGPQNWDEMSGPFIGLILDVKTPPETVLKRSGPSLLKPVPGQAGPTLATVSVNARN